MNAISSKEQREMISAIQKEIIPTYRVFDLRESISGCKNPGIDKVVFLIDLLENQINVINGQLTKKINKIRALGTFD